MKNIQVNFSNPVDNAIWREGYTACQEMLDGRPIRKNPYEDVEARIWDQGWEDAEYDNEM